MATTTNLGGVFTTDTDGNLASSVMVSTENVCGIIFDTKGIGGIATALGSGTKAATTFANGNVIEVNTMDDVDEAGLDENVMKGLPYYHVSRFFTLAGTNKRLFLSFMDSSTDTTFSAVEKMQTAAGGIIYQIGVWTAEPIATAGSGDEYTLIEGGVISKLQAQAELLGGKVNQTNYDGNAPVNILLNAPIVGDAVCDYNKLPDIANMNCYKVSMLIGQASSDSVHALQLALNTAVQNTPNFAVVGNIGAAMAVLAVAPAHESIGNVGNYNLSSIITEAELGFGNVALNEAGNAYADTVSFTKMNTIGYVKRNNKLHKKGYIFLMNYDGLENGIFFSSDQTLAADSDYRTIARGRVIHKSRRVVRRALLPYVNSTIEIDASSGTLSSNDVSRFQNVVLEALDMNMISPVDNRTPQISGRQCTIDPNQNILDNDELHIDYRLVPLGLVSGIYVTEGFTRTVSAS